MNPTNANTLTFGDWLTQWCHAYKECYVRPSTAAMYRHMVNLIQRYPIVKVTPQDISEDTIGDTLNALYRDKYSRSTIVKASSVIRQALSALDLSPIGKRRPIPAAPTKTVRAVTEDEWCRLRQAWISEPMGNLHIFLATTGLRCDELLNLQWSDYEQTTGTIYIRQSKTPSGVRHLPLLELDKKIIEDQPHINEYIFNKPNGQRLTKGAMRYFYTKIRKKACVPTLTNHVLRHTFASHLVEEDCPIKAVTKLLGHASEKSTSVYVNPPEAYLTSQIFRLKNRYAEE